MPTWTWSSAKREIEQRADAVFASKISTVEFQESPKRFLAEVVFDQEPDEVTDKLTSGRPVSGVVAFPGGYRSDFTAKRGEEENLMVDFKTAFEKVDYRP